MSKASRLRWLLIHQPNNRQAINSLAAQLGLPTIKKSSGKLSAPYYPFSKGYVQRQIRNVTIHY